MNLIHLAAFLYLNQRIIKVIAMKYVNILAAALVEEPFQLTL